MAKIEKDKKSGLSDTIRDLKSKRQKALDHIIRLAWARRHGFIGSFHPYNFEPSFADWIIDTLADVIIWDIEKNKPKGEIDFEVLEKIGPFFQAIKLEIERIFSAIKRVGFSAYIVDADKRWQTAALECFDDSKQGLKLSSESI